MPMCRARARIMSSGIAKSHNASSNSALEKTNSSTTTTSPASFKASDRIYALFPDRSVRAYHSERAREVKMEEDEPPSSQCGRTCALAAWMLCVGTTFYSQ